MKRKILYIVICALVLLVILLLSIWSNSHKENNTIRVGYNVGNVNYGPFYVAYVKDFFGEHDVIVEPIPLKSSSEVNIALSAGQIDIALCGVTDLFIPISKAIPIKVIAPMASAPLYLYVRPDNKIKTFEDLLGKTIAARPGGAVDFGIRYVLGKEKIDTSKITFANIDKVYRPVALMEKKIVDAVPIGEDEIATYVEAGAVPHEEWETKGYHNQNTPENAIAVNEGFKLSHESLIEQFINVMIEGHRFIKSNPEESAQIVSSYIQNETDGTVMLLPENIVDMWANKKLEYNLWYDPVALVDMSKIAVEIGQIDSSLTLEQIYDFSFEEKLRAAQNEIYPTN